MRIKREKLNADAVCINKKLVELLRSSPSVTFNKNWDDASENIYLLRAIINCIRMKPQANGPSNQAKPPDASLVASMKNMISQSVGLATIGAELVGKGELSHIYYSFVCSIYV